MSEMTSTPETQTAASMVGETAEQTRTSTPRAASADTGRPGSSAWVESATTTPWSTSTSTTRIVPATSKTGETRPFQTGIAIFMLPTFATGVPIRTVRPDEGARACESLLEYSKTSHPEHRRAVTRPGTPRLGLTDSWKTCLPERDCSTAESKDLLRVGAVFRPERSLRSSGDLPTARPRRSLRSA